MVWIDLSRYGGRGTTRKKRDGRSDNEGFRDANSLSVIERERAIDKQELQYTRQKAQGMRREDMIWNGQASPLMSNFSRSAMNGYERPITLGFISGHLPTLDGSN
jgi:hypothetical protein